MHARDRTRYSPRVPASSRTVIVSRHHRRSRHLLRAHGRRSARVQYEVSRTALSQRGTRRPRSPARECGRAVGVGQRGGALSRPQRGAHVDGTRSRMARPRRRVARRSTATRLTSWWSRGKSPRSGAGSGITATSASSTGRRNTRSIASSASSIRKIARRYDRGENVETEYLWPMRD